MHLQKLIHVYVSIRLLLLQFKKHIPFWLNLHWFLFQQRHQALLTTIVFVVCLEAVPPFCMLTTRLTDCLRLWAGLHNLLADIASRTRLNNTWHMTQQKRAYSTFNKIVFRLAVFVCRTP